MNIDWSLVFLALTTIFSFFVMLMEYYYRVYRPRAKDKEQKRSEIYKPLLMDVDALIEIVRAKKFFSPPFNWKTVEDKVSTDLFMRLQKLFQEKVDNYHKLLKHNNDFIRFKGYYYLNSHLPELQEEYKSKGFGGLEFQLYESIIIPLLEGEKITLRWLEDKRPELHETLMKCQNYKKLKRLLDYLNEENSSIVPFRRAEQDLLQLAKKMKDEFKSF